MLIRDFYIQAKKELWVLAAADCAVYCAQAIGDSGLVLGVGIKSGVAASRTGDRDCGVHAERKR